MAAAIEPIRGQMVLLSLPSATLSRIVNEGSRYLVPRGDGRVLVGSTEEAVGFDRGTTAVAANELLQFAFSLAPNCRRRRSNRLGPACAPRRATAGPTWGRRRDWKTCTSRPGIFAADCSFRPPPRW